MAAVVLPTESRFVGNLANLIGKVTAFPARPPALSAIGPERVNGNCRTNEEEHAERCDGNTIGTDFSADEKSNADQYNRQSRQLRLPIASPLVITKASPWVPFQQVSG